MYFSSAQFSFRGPKRQREGVTERNRERGGGGGEEKVREGRKIRDRKEEVGRKDL